MNRRLLRRTGFHALRLGTRLLALGGMPAVRRGGEWFGAWHYRFGGRKRRALLDQIVRLPAPQLSDQQARQMLREAYRVNDRAILEIIAAYSGAVSPEDLAKAVRLRGLERLEQARAAGRGVVLLGMHSGNGVALAVHLGQLGYPVHVVYRESNKISPNFFRDGIRRQGLNAIPALPPATGVRQMLGALRAGEILFILMDQASKRGGVAVSFLGKRLHLPPGPVELARRTGAPIIPAVLDAVDEQWQFRLDPAIHLDRSRELELEVKIVGDLMQRLIIAQPQWWSWHQRRWWRHPFTDEASPPTRQS